jgi:protein-disulfide isomerase/Tfp pilus assembly protein PilF
MALAAVGVNPGDAQAQVSDTDADKAFAGRPEDARRFVKDYIAKNPQILQEVLPGLRQPMRPPVENRTVIKSSAAAFVSGRVPLGNPKGDVTLVELVDFNCLPCKRALPLLLDLVKADSGLRIVMIHHPILGPGSVEAARIAIALQMHSSGADKYPEFHEKLLAGPGRVDKARALAVAAEVGIDVARLGRRRASGDAVLEDARRLARALGLRGVPSYMVGDNILRGGTDAGTFKTKISVARQEQLDSLRHCDQNEHPELKMAACTSVIGRGDLDKEALAKAYVNRCDAYRARHRHDRAMLDCNEAVELNPATARAFASRSAVHAARRRYEPALADIGEAIRLDPKVAQFHISRGTIHTAGKAFAEAVADFNAAIDIVPRSHVAYFRRANAYRSMSQPDRAIADYDEAIRLIRNTSRRICAATPQCAKRGPPSKARPAIALLPGGANATCSALRGPARQGARRLHRRRRSIPGWRWPRCKSVELSQARQGLRRPARRGTRAGAAAGTRARLRHARPHLRGAGAQGGGDRRLPQGPGADAGAAAEPGRPRAPRRHALTPRRLRRIGRCASTLLPPGPIWPRSFSLSRGRLTEGQLLLPPR